jgi:XTP/dITP diphosphohydrolase
MTLILASSNKGKIKELKNLVPFFNVIAYSEVLEPFDIEETGDTFKQNAILKAKAMNNALKNINYPKNYMVLADDSGITVPALNNEPNIYSARYAGIDATDKQNNEKLIANLKAKNIKKTLAYYTACLALVYNDKVFTAHGWMYGDVIDKEEGSGGFGYDPLFIPNGYQETLGLLPCDIKKELSHRTKALRLMEYIIKQLV